MASSWRAGRDLGTCMLVGKGVTLDDPVDGVGTVWFVALVGHGRIDGVAAIE